MKIILYKTVLNELSGSQLVAYLKLCSGKGHLELRCIWRSWLDIDLWDNSISAVTVVLSGAAGRAVAFNTRKPQFESHHRQSLNCIFSEVLLLSERSNFKSNLSARNTTPETIGVVFRGRWTRHRRIRCRRCFCHCRLCKCRRRHRRRLCRCRSCNRRFCQQCRWRLSRRCRWRPCRPCRQCR